MEARSPKRFFFHLILDIVGNSRQEIKRWRIDDRFYLPAWKPSPQAEHSLKPLSYWLQPPTLMVRSISPKKKDLILKEKKPSAPLPRLFKSPAPGCIHTQIPFPPGYTLLVSKQLQLGQIGCVSTPKPSVELPTTLLHITSPFCPDPLDAFKVATRCQWG